MNSQSRRVWSQEKLVIFLADDRHFVIVAPSASDVKLLVWSSHPTHKHFPPISQNFRVARLFIFKDCPRGSGRQFGGWVGESGGEGKGLKEAEGVVELPICRNSWKEINSVRSICKKKRNEYKKNSVRIVSL